MATSTRFLGSAYDGCGREIGLATKLGMCVGHIARAGNKTEVSPPKRADVSLAENGIGEIHAASGADHRGYDREPAAAFTERRIVSAISVEHRGSAVPRDRARGKGGNRGLCATGQTADRRFFPAGDRTRVRPWDPDLMARRIRRW